MIHRPALGDDADHNRRVLQETLDSAPAGKLELPSGTWTLSDGLRVPAGWSVRGAEVAGAGGGRPATWLVSTGGTGHPILHVVGSDVAVSDLGLRPPPADPGEHGGDRGTAITVGDYLYAATPEWISRVDVRRVTVERAEEKHANCIALMGAVSDITLDDITVRGGYTAVAVHWGAVGGDVATIEGPTYHPHRLTITDLRVSDALEGFYLSSVHDVRVSGACLHNVEMGFRLLPGDNTDRFVTSDVVGSRIEIADVCVRWSGPRYGARLAGWGKSEIDGLVSVLKYSETTVRDCTFRGTGTGKSWSPVLIEQADGIEFHNIVAATTWDLPEGGRCCPVAAPTPAYQS